MKRPIILHPNYCEEGQPLEALFRLARDLGADGVEVRRTRSDTPDSGNYLAQLGRLRDKYKTEWLIVGGSLNLTLPGECERRREVDAAIDFYQRAREQLGVKLFNVLTGWLQHPDPALDYLKVEYHGSAAVTPAGWQWQIEGLRELGRAAESLGVRLALETHACYVHDLPGPTAELLRQVGSPNVGALLDYANYMLFKQRPTIAQAVAALSGRIFYSHLKNLIILETGQRITTPLGDGQVNNRNLLAALFEDHYNAPLCIEAPRRGDGEWFARQDITYLRHLLEALQATSSNSAQTA